MTSSRELVRTAADLGLPNGPTSTPNISESEARHRALVKILFDDHAAHNIPLPAPRDLDIKAQTFLPVTRSIPTEHLYECYVTALESREPGVNYLISGIEMLNAWKGVVKPRLEREADGIRALPENAAGACQRCFGTGNEEMPDGTVRPGCEHKPLTEADKAERDRLKAERIAEIRAEMKKIGKPKPPPADARPKRPDYDLRCDSCPRKVSSTFGSFEVGSQCGDLLNRGTHDGDLKFCEGRFVAL